MLIPAARGAHPRLCRFGRGGTILTAAAMLHFPDLLMSGVLDALRVLSGFWHGRVSNAIIEDGWLNVRSTNEKSAVRFAGDLCSHPSTPHSLA